ncbi:MAG TPA: GNAT family N-acetyltransferase [Chitinophagaceae bacterium]|nr:GNAT family N-acetyltransferase [Chitinophagaceae bacterium]
MLATERLIIRNWIDSDTVPFIALNKDADVMKYFPKPLTGEETIQLLERIKNHLASNSFGLWAVEHKLTGQFLGFTGLGVPRFEAFFTPCVEIGWRFIKKAWGQGFATEAASACLQYGVEVLHMEKIVSFTSVLNTRSENVMKRLGMMYVSEFGHPNIAENNILCRHVLYQLERDTFIKPGGLSTGV